MWPNQQDAINWALIFFAAVLISIAVISCGSPQKPVQRSEYCFVQWTDEPACYATYTTCRQEEITLTERAPWAVKDRSCALQPARK